MNTNQDVSTCNNSVLAEHANTAIASVSVDLEYDRFVERLAKAEDPRTISNSSTRHALSILRAIFRHAKRSVSIFSGKLDPNVFNDDELLRTAENFQKGGGSLRVLLQDQALSKNDASKLLLQLAAQSSDVNDASCMVKQVTSEHPFADAKCHFVVADGKAYRIETDIVKHIAVGSFMDEKSATALTEIFDKAFVLATTKPFEFSRV
ncbi:MAG: hypothetical protein HY847_09760 [Betaproteobacteria bacterium]|nr:hypothetical protein [Betaproteobacteria bacterium]